MTKLSTVPQGWRRDEGVPPYRNGVTPAKDLSFTNNLPAGGRGRPPLPRFNKRNVISPSVASRQLPAYKGAENKVVFLGYHPTTPLHTHFRPLKRCGVWDTVASVPAAFLHTFFSARKKYEFCSLSFLKKIFVTITKNLLFVSFAKKRFVTISKVSHSGSESEGRAKVPQSSATGADAKRERATLIHAVAKKNGADRDNRREKTAGAYYLYVTAVF